MAYLIAILLTLGLFVAFIVLTVFEKRRKTRLLGGLRSRLDMQAAKAVDIAKSADPLDFVIRGGRVIAGHVFHDIANVAWALVRMLERTLAGTVRRLRHMRKPEERTETNSGFVKSISYFKRGLRTPERPVEGVTAEEVV